VVLFLAILFWFLYRRRRSSKKDQITLHEAPSSPAYGVQSPVSEMDALSSGRGKPQFNGSASPIRHEIFAKHQPTLSELPGSPVVRNISSEEADEGVDDTTTTDLKQA
jgi:hypothetical protein